MFDHHDQRLKSTSLKRLHGIKRAIAFSAEASACVSILPGPRPLPEVQRWKQAVIIQISGL